LAGRGHARFVGERDERGAVAAAELAQHVADVGLRGQRTDREPARDLGAPQALGAQAHNLALARRQPGERGPRSAANSAIKSTTAETEPGSRD